MRFESREKPCLTSLNSKTPTGSASCNDESNKYSRMNKKLVASHPYGIEVVSEISKVNFAQIEGKCFLLDPLFCFHSLLFSSCTTTSSSPSFSFVFLLLLFPLFFFFFFFSWISSTSSTCFFFLK